MASKVTFGVHLPVRMLAGGDPVLPSPRLLEQIADAAGGSGFSALWVTDHIVYPDPWMDCLLMLAAVAGRARDAGLTIATGVVGLPLRHPVAMAQSFATLDVLSGGNLIIGVGEGSTQLDFDALGLPFQERRRMLEDGAAALRTLLTDPVASHEGPYYRFQNVTVAPKSIQRPCPPIWLSSWGSPIGLRRVARLADGWVASAWHSTPDEFSAALATLNSALAEHRKDPGAFPNAVNTMFVYVDQDGRRARDTAAPIIEQATRAPYDADSGHYVAGDYAECRAHLQRWIDAGAQRICLWPVRDSVEQVRRLGQHVLPGLSSP